MSEPTKFQYMPKRPCKNGHLAPRNRKTRSCIICDNNRNKAKWGSPGMPSIDRIDSTRGYEPNNIVVVSTRANLLKGDATRMELIQLADFYGRMNNGKQ